jgi:hypothetical protein
MLFNKKIAFLTFIQWFALIGIVAGRYVEVAFVLTIILVLAKGDKLYKVSRVVIGLFLLGIYSLVLIYLNSYSYLKFFQQILILSICIYGYAQFFKAIKGEVSALFHKYIQLMYILCILGLLQFIICYIAKIDIFPYTLDGYIEAKPIGGFMRIHSVFNEAGNLGTCLVPIIGFILFDKNFYRNNKKKSIIFISTLLLTLATISYFLLALLLIIKLYQKSSYFKYIYILVLIFALPVVINIMDSNTKDQEIDSYDFLPMIQKKIIETSSIFDISTPEDFQLLNTSSYALLTNLWVANHAPSRLFGTGLGTHQENYIKMYPPNNYYEYGLNSEDGYSLFNRIYSEFGFLGITLYLIFLIRCFNFKNTINFCVFFLLLSLLIRGGHYTVYGTVFFHLMYYYTSKRIKTQTTNVNTSLISCYL